MKKDKDIFDRLMNLPPFRPFQPFYQKHKEVLLYLFFGGLTTVISIVSYALLCGIGWDALVANVGSWLLAVLFAYVTNSIWVFVVEVRSFRERLRQIVSFYGGRVATLVMEEVILLVFVKLLAFNSLAVKIAAQVLVVIANYLISKLIVFREKK